MASESKHSGGLLVGLTGGIASGKSTVADCFAQRGIPVIDTDRISRELVEPADGEQLLQQLVAHFGSGILTSEGLLDRAALRQQVFTDDRARAELEALMHPAIRRRALARARTAAQHAPYVLVVVPLLAEEQVWPHYDWLDRVITITAGAAQQRQRLQQRPGIGADLARRMLASQTDDAARTRIADFQIDNSGPRSALTEQVARIDARLRRSNQPDR